MTLVQVQAQLSPEELVKAVEQLDNPELERFVGQVLSLRAYRNAPALVHSEAELLRRIRDDFSAEFFTRYDDLLDKRDDDTLTAAEADELVAMLDKLEMHQADRLKCVGQLATIHNTTFDAMIQLLGIHPRPRRNE
ncbi:MAG: STAS/SEC14 domain-containing protein [Chloroflexota bacterium]|nr:STAS/SEC14 domain-containing protein [Chloroflexota bacterium]